MLNRCWKTCHACRILLNVMSTISSWPTLQSRVNGAVWEAFYEYLEGCWCSGNQGWRGEGSSRWGSWALMFSGARTSILINPHHNSLGAMLWDIFNAIKPSSVQQENSLDVQDNMKWFFQVWQSPPWTGFEMFRLSENWPTQRFFQVEGVDTSKWPLRSDQVNLVEKVECGFKFTKLLLLAVPSFYLNCLLLKVKSPDWHWCQSVRCPPCRCCSRCWCPCSRCRCHCRCPPSTSAHNSSVLGCNQAKPRPPKRSQLMMYYSSEKSLTSLSSFPKEEHMGGLEGPLPLLLKEKFQDTCDNNVSWK